MGLGEVYFEVTVEKSGDGGLLGLALQNVEPWPEMSEVASAIQGPKP